MNTNYKLKTGKEKNKKGKKMKSSLKKLLPLLKDEKSKLWITFVTVIINSVASLISPIII
jgi:ABC-type bacteriocin/lantibiotic exporter with double-glycine peptidase domain